MLYFDESITIDQYILISVVQLANFSLLFGIGHNLPHVVKLFRVDLVSLAYLPIVSYIKDVYLRPARPIVVVWYPVEYNRHQPAAPRLKVEVSRPVAQNLLEVLHVSFLAWVGDSDHPVVTRKHLFSL